MTDSSHPRPIWEDATASAVGAPEMLSPLHMKVLNFLGEDTPQLPASAVSIGAAEVSTDIGITQGDNPAGSDSSRHDESLIGSTRVDLNELFTGSFINRTDLVSDGTGNAALGDTDRELQTMRLIGGALVTPHADAGSSSAGLCSASHGEAGAESCVATCREAVDLSCNDPKAQPELQQHDREEAPPVELKTIRRHEGLDLQQVMATSSAVTEVHDLSDTCAKTLLFPAPETTASQSLGKEAVELKTLRRATHDLFRNDAGDLIDVTGLCDTADKQNTESLPNYIAPARQDADAGSQRLFVPRSPWKRVEEAATVPQSFNPGPRPLDGSGKVAMVDTREAHKAIKREGQEAEPTPDVLLQPDASMNAHGIARHASQKAAIPESDASELFCDGQTSSAASSPPSVCSGLPPPRPRMKSTKPSHADKLAGPTRASPAPQQRRGGEEVVVESPHAVRDRLQRLHVRQQRQHRAQSANSALARPPVPPSDPEQPAPASPPGATQAARPLRSANSSANSSPQTGRGSASSRPPSRLPRPRSSCQVDDASNLAQAEGANSRPSSVGRRRVSSAGPSSARRDPSKRGASAGPSSSSRSGVQSNRKLIRNALERYCLKGDANREQRESILHSFDQELPSFQRFVILFRSIHTGRHDLRALYGYQEQAWVKVLEVLPSPPHLEESMVAQSLRYDSGGKEFREIPAVQESLNVADAVFMQPQYLRKSRLST